MPKYIIEGVDLMAGHWNTTKRVEAYIRNEGLADIPEIENVQVLVNIQLLLRFMMLDMAAIVNAYLKSSSDIEYALNLRRVCVTKYGYTYREHEQSIWKRIEDMIPLESSELISHSNNIGNLLQKIVSQSHDKNLRATFVHLFDNSKICSDLTDVVDTIEGINPIIQVAEIYLLLEVYKLLENFSATLMNVLAQEAHEKNVQSNKTINDQMNKFIHDFEESKLPDDQKKQLIDMMKETKRKINDLLTL